MKQMVTLTNSGIIVDENGTASIPLDVQIRIVNHRTLKAVAKLTYADFVINDINIIEDRGRIDIRFPQKPFTKNGVERKISVSFPGVPELSSQLNHAILKAYSEKMLEEQNNILENINK